VSIVDDELAGCLRAWRERLAPAEAGVPAGARRRVSGLRREEVASLAGVSVDYLSRLEQGRAQAPVHRPALARGARRARDRGGRGHDGGRAARRPRALPADEHLSAMIADLREISPRFAELWRQHPVARVPVRRKTFAHPEVGMITVDCNALSVQGSDLDLIVYTAPAGSPDAAALELLATIGLQSFAS
jgi:transcriptional regulator with XRE-family HTH domain